MKNLALAGVIVFLTVTGCASERPPSIDSSSTQSSIDVSSDAAGQEGSEKQVVTFADGEFEIEFPSEWNENEQDNPYDLQYISAKQNMNTGIFLYKSIDLGADSTPQQTFTFHVEDLQTKRENFTVLEPETTASIADKTLTTVVYSGENEGGKNYYKITLIEFAEQPEQFLIVLQVSLPSVWDESKPMLEAITQSASPIL